MREEIEVKIIFRPKMVREPWPRRKKDRMKKFKRDTDAIECLWIDRLDHELNRVFDSLEISQ